MGKKEWMERFELALERIQLIRFEDTVKEPYETYFKHMGLFIEQMAKLYEYCANGMYYMFSMEELEEWNQICYKELEGDSYKNSYINPEYAKEKLGEEFGQLLSFLALELRKLSRYAVRQELYLFVIYMELFIELYNMFEESTRDEIILSYRKVRDVIYWFISDYSDVFIPKQMEEMMMLEKNFTNFVFQENDLEESRYLYLFGENITQKEKRRVSLVHQYPREQWEEFIGSIIVELQEKQTKMFNETTGNFEKSLKEENQEKRWLSLQYERGYEWVVKELMEQLKSIGIIGIPCERMSDMGLWCGNDLFSENHSVCTNAHRFDFCLYFDKALVERMLSVTKVTYENQRETMNHFCGVIQLVEVPTKEEKLPLEFHCYYGKDEIMYFVDENARLEEEMLEQIQKYRKGINLYGEWKAGQRKLIEHIEN